MMFRHVGHGLCVFIETIPELISNIRSSRHPPRKKLPFKIFIDCTGITGRRNEMPCAQISYVYETAEIRGKFSF